MTGPRWRTELACLAVGTAALAAIAPSSTQAATDPQQSVADAGSALGSRFSGPNWYDATNDRLKPVPMPRVRERSFEGSGGGLDLSWLSGAAWVLLAIAIGVIVYLLVRAFWLARKDRTGRGDEAPDRALRVEALPVSLDWGAGDLLTMARRLRSEGDFRQAMIYLFSHSLLELDRCQAIRLAKGKTNRQYAAELRHWSPGAYEPFGEGIVAFEDVFFGERDIDAQRLDYCWEQLDRAVATAAFAGAAT